MRSICASCGRYRELVYFLAWRDVKVRYKQTALGIAWVVLQPLAAMAIFSVVFGRLANLPSDGVPYPLFVFAGLVPWFYFANATSTRQRQPGGEYQSGQQGVLPAAGGSAGGGAGRSG